MSFRATPLLAGSVHASLALMDSLWLIEPERGLAAFHALSGVTWEQYRPHAEGLRGPTSCAADGLRAAGSGTIADGSHPQTASYSPSVVPVDGQAANSALHAALLVTEDGADPADLVARDRDGWGLGYYRVGGVAIVQIEGPMQKQDAWSMEGTSTVRTRRALRRALRDEAVESILLLIDSPGGQVSGTHELAMDVRKAASQVPVYAYCEDCCCSAAYYVASQANLVYASPGALVGSIGVYATLYDLSKAAEAQGVIVHVVKDGEEKGDFTPGTPVTSEQLARMQQIVDFYGTQFRKAVSETRFPGQPLAKGVSPAKGDVFLGAEARRVGLVDGVTSLDNVLAAMRKRKRK